MQIVSHVPLIHKMICIFACLGRESTRNGEGIITDTLINKRNPSCTVRHLMVCALFYIDKVIYFKEAVKCNMNHTFPFINIVLYTYRYLEIEMTSKEEWIVAPILLLWEISWFVQYLTKTHWFKERSHQLLLASHVHWVTYRLTQMVELTCKEEWIIT